MRRVCILPGTYTLDSPVRITDKHNLIVSGCGQQARIFGPGLDSAFVIARGGRIALEGLSVSASSPQQGTICVRHSPGFRMADCLVSNITNIENAPAALEVVDSDGVTIVDSAFSGSPCVSVRAQQGTVIARNSLGGGLWVGDGSTEILIRDNIIAWGEGPGILLGGQRSVGELTGVRTVEILGNTIHQMTNSGISTVAETAREGSGDIEDVTIAHNRITRCAREAADARFDSEAVGGIVLRDVVLVNIHGNHIAGNGAEGEHLACGVFVHGCLGLEVSGNAIGGNGSTSVEDGGTAYQAGIAALFVQGGTSMPAARVHDNVVVCPKGHALILTGLGPMSVSGNSLTSQDARGPLEQWRRLGQLVEFGKCVFILNLGRTPVLSGVMDAGAAEVGLSEGERVISRATPGVLVRWYSTLDPEGRVLFHDNQVTLRAPGMTWDEFFAAVREKNIVNMLLDAGSSVLIISFDDVSLQGNQVLAEVNGFILANVVTLGLTVRASANRFAERPLATLYSYLSWGWRGIATGNQAFNCLFAGGNSIDPNNQQPGRCLTMSKTDEDS